MQLYGDYGPLDFISAMRLMKEKMEWFEKLAEEEFPF